MLNNSNLMYLRPGNLFKEFVIESNEQVVMPTGRVANKYNGNGTMTLKGCLAEATEDDMKRHNHIDYVITHTIVQSGRARAGRSDKLILGNRVFYIVDVDECGSLGVATIYYAEERRDVK
jgi:hypothetical protein